MQSDQPIREEASPKIVHPASTKPLTGDLNEPLNDFNRYSVKFDLEDEEEPVAAQPLTTLQIVLYSAIAIVVVLFLYFVVRYFGKDAFDMVIHTLRSLVKSSNPLSILLLGALQFVFGWVLFMPGLSTFNILQAFLMQSFWKSFLITFIGSYLASLTLFLIIKKFFRKQIIEKFRRKILFRIVYLEVKKRPWQMGLLFNLLFIPASLKNYLMPLTSITVEQYAIVIFPVHMFYCAMFAFVGYSVKDINTLFHDKPFSEKSTAQQVQTVVTYFLLVLTIALMIAFFILAKKKYTEIEEEHKMQAELAKEKMKELDVISAHKHQA